MRGLAAIAAVLGALCLSGCFVARAPLYLEAAGACPFTQPTDLVMTENDAEERIRFEADGAFCKTTEAALEGKAEKTDRVLFVPIGANTWILQDDDAGAQTYHFMTRSGRTWRAFAPKCEDLSDGRLKKLNLALEANGRDCIVTSAEQLEAAIRAWRGPFRRPSGLYRAEPSKTATP
jgi:hypothetical protein